MYMVLNENNVYRELSDGDIVSAVENNVVTYLKLIQNRVKGEGRKVFKQVLKKWDIREEDLTGGGYQ